MDVLLNLIAASLILSAPGEPGWAAAPGETGELVSRVADASSAAFDGAGAGELASDAPRVEVLFVLDSTGSMSSAIREAKEHILEIATSIAAGDPRPDVRFGIVTYRDRGDDYVTKRYPLTRRWNDTRAALSEIKADGGGDTPESVIQALHEGLRDTAWTMEDDVVKIVYLIGDAPPKIYEDDPDYRDDLRWALQNGIVVHAVGCGGLSGDGRDFFRDVALASEGHYHGLGRAARAELATGDAVRAAEDEPRPTHRTPESLASVVKATAKAYSGERGVTYADDGGAPVESSPLLAPGVTIPTSGLNGEHARLVSDARAFRLLWATHTSTMAAPAPLPAVDFERNSILVLTARAGGLQVASVADGDDGLVVRTRADRSAPRVVFHLLPAHSGPVHFVAEGGAK